MHTSGSALRAERAAARVTVKALSDALKMSRTTLWALERAEIVDERTAWRYRAGLEVARRNAA